MLKFNHLALAFALMSLIALPFVRAQEPELKTICPILIKQGAPVYEDAKKKDALEKKKFKARLKPTVESVKRFLKTLTKDDQPLIQTAENSGEWAYPTEVASLRKRLGESVNCAADEKKVITEIAVSCLKGGNVVRQFRFEHKSVGHPLMHKLYLNAVDFTGEMITFQVHLGTGEEDFDFIGQVNPYLKPFPDQKTYLIETLKVPAACFEEKKATLAQEQVESAVAQPKDPAIKRPLQGQINNKNIVDVAI